MENGIYRIKFHTKEGHFENGKVHTLYLVAHFKGGKPDGGAFFCSKDWKWRSNPMRFERGKYVYESKAERILGNAWTNRDRDWPPILLIGDSEMSNIVRFMKKGTLGVNEEAVDDLCSILRRSSRFL